MSVVAVVSEKLIVDWKLNWFDSFGHSCFEKNNHGNFCYGCSSYKFRLEAASCVIRNICSEIFRASSKVGKLIHI